jgi:uncharacterized Zn finger protein
VRENAERKGRRYLAEGRLTVERVDVAGVRATCRGAGALYSLGYENGRRHCSCPAAGRCAHLVGLMLVTVREAA